MWLIKIVNRKKIELLTLFFSLNFHVLSQNLDSLSILSEDSTNNIFFVGESHDEFNSIYKFDILKILCQKNESNTIFIELPKELQIPLNKYFISDFKFESYIRKFQNPKDIMNFLKLIKENYLSQIKEGKLKVICFDISTFKSPLEDVELLLKNFPENKSLNGRLMEQKHNPTNELIFFRDLKTIIDNDSLSFKSFFNEYYYLFYDIIQDNIKIHSVKDPFFSYEIDEYRESNIAHYILMNLGDKRNVIYTGWLHIINNDRSPFSDTDHRYIVSLYERLNMTRKFNIIRIGIVFLPIKKLAGKFFWRPEAEIDKKFWNNQVKGKRYLFTNVENGTGMSNDLSDYILCINKENR